MNLYLYVGLFVVIGLAEFAIVYLCDRLRQLEQKHRKPTGN